MRIENLSIGGFKGLRHFELRNLPDLVVLVGPNGAGKSSVLEAIGLLKDWVASYTNARLPEAAAVGEVRVNWRARRISGWNADPSRYFSFECNLAKQLYRISL